MLLQGTICRAEQVAEVLPCQSPAHVPLETQSHALAFSGPPHWHPTQRPGS